MDRRVNYNEFNRIRPLLKGPKTFQDHIKFILNITKCKNPNFARLIKEQKSIDSILKNSSEAEKFLVFLKTSYYSMNILKAKFIEVGNQYPDCTISSLDPSSIERQICDKFFDYLQQKVGELYYLERPGSHNKKDTNGFEQGFNDLTAYLNNT